MSLDDTPSVGRIVLIGVVLVVFFSILAQAMSFIANSIRSVDTLTEDLIGKHYSFMPTLTQVSLTISDWLYIVFTNPISLAVLVMIAFVYWVMNER